MALQAIDTNVNEVLVVGEEPRLTRYNLQGQQARNQKNWFTPQSYIPCGISCPCDDIFALSWFMLKLIQLCAGLTLLPVPVFSLKQISRTEVVPEVCYSVEVDHNTDMVVVAGTESSIQVTLSCPLAYMASTKLILVNCSNSIFQGMLLSMTRLVLPGGVSWRAVSWEGDK